MHDCNPICPACLEAEVELAKRQVLEMRYRPRRRDVPDAVEYGMEEEAGPPSLLGPRSERDE